MCGVPLEVFGGGVCCSRWGWLIHPLSSCQDVLEFRVKIRPLQVKTVDGTVKTVLVGGLMSCA